MHKYSKSLSEICDFDLSSSNTFFLFIFKISGDPVISFGSFISLLISFFLFILIIFKGHSILSVNSISLFSISFFLFIFNGLGFSIVTFGLFISLLISFLVFIGDLISSFCLLLLFLLLISGLISSFILNLSVLIVSSLLSLFFVGIVSGFLLISISIKSPKLKWFLIL